MKLTRRRLGELAAGVAVLGLGLWSFSCYHPHIGFDFLGNHHRVFYLNTGLGGEMCEVYSFAAPRLAVIDGLRNELEAKGVDCKIDGDCFEYADHPVNRICIVQGRTVSKHWADYEEVVDSDQDPNWTTVKVYFRDPMDPSLRKLVGHPH